MSEEFRTAMAEVVAHVRPLLGEAGFRRRHHSFNRTKEPGLVHVVSYGMGKPLPPGTIELPGLRQSLHGLFDVQAGVFVEEVWRLQTGRGAADRTASAKVWINDYDCQLRTQIQNPAGQSTNLMWPLVDPDSGSTMADLLREKIFPWLDRFDSRAAIITALESSPVSSYQTAGMGPDRLLAVYLRLGSGDRAGAQRNLDAWSHYCWGRLASEPHLKGHLDHLVDVAERAGLRPPVSH